MARIRTIKPEFWQDEKLAPLCAVDRLVFLGLLSMADDAGRLVDNVKLIDGFLFPETDETARASLDRLVALGRVVRYRGPSGQKLLQVANWAKHQKVDNAAKYVLPAPPASRETDEQPAERLAPEPEPVAEPSRDSRETLSTVSRSDLGPTTTDLRPPTSTAAPAAVGGTNGRHAPEPPSVSPQSGGGVPAAPPRRRPPRPVAASPEVGAVFERYRERHPLSRPGSEAQTRLVLRHLADGYTAAELCEAIDGNADDEWHRTAGKHELGYVLRSRDTIDDFRGRYAAQQRSTRPLKEIDPDRYYALGGV